MARQVTAAERGEGTFGLDAVRAVDRWLTAMAADREGGDRRSRLRRTRPEAGAGQTVPAQPDRSYDDVVTPEQQA